MIVVHIWSPTDEFYGHTSIEVDGGRPAGSIYVSWWPVRNVGTIECTDARTMTFEQDVRMEGRQPSFSLRVNGLIETAIKTWWRRFARENGQWCTIGMNCSDVVVRALEAGGSKRFVNAEEWHHNWSIWRPNTVLAYVRDLRRGLVRRPRRSLADVERDWRRTQDQWREHGHPMLRVRAGGRYY